MISTLLSCSDVTALLSCLLTESRKRTSWFVIVAPQRPALTESTLAARIPRETSSSLSSTESSPNTRSHSSSGCRYICDLRRPPSLSSATGRCLPRILGLRRTRLHERRLEMLEAFPWCFQYRLIPTRTAVGQGYL